MTLHKVVHVHGRAKRFLRCIRCLARRMLEASSGTDDRDRHRHQVRQLQVEQLARDLMGNNIPMSRLPLFLDTEHNDGIWSFTLDDLLYRQRSFQ